jgi:hypothetical protein
LKLLILLLVATSINAATLIVHGPCSNSAKYVFSHDIETDDTVGDFTVRVLSRKNISFKGNAAGINQIENSPVSSASLEIISDTHMRSYGWCYSINDKVLESYPSQVPMNADSKIYWYYAYAEYKAGQWISQCQPSFKLKSKYICN